MNELNELYYRDAYRTEFEAEVLSCRQGKKAWEVVLSQTAFYPEGGGQPADNGSIDTASVSDVHERDGVIVHYCDKPVEEGQMVFCRIDWERRFDHMQNHSGEHIVSGLIFKHYGYDNIGFHLGPEEILIDFNGLLTKEQIETVELEANRIIWSNAETKITYPTEEERNCISYRSKIALSGTVRLVEFPEADLCACCGTHVRRTGEIGLIKITSSEKHKNGTRLHLLCGKRALCDYIRRNEETAAAGALLSAKPYEISSHVERLLEDNGRKLRQIHSLTVQLLKKKAELVPVGQDVVVDFADNLDAATLREYANLLREERKAGTAAVFSQTSSEQFSYVIITDHFDLKKLSGLMNELFSGRGGGNRNMIQGSCSGTEPELKSFLKKELNFETEA